MAFHECLLASTTANDAELNHTRRRLSVLSDNKLVDGVDNLNLDSKVEGQPTETSVPGSLSRPVRLIQYIYGCMANSLLIAFHHNRLQLNYHLLLFCNSLAGYGTGSFATFRWIHCEQLWWIFQKRICPLQSKEKESRCFGHGRRPQNQEFGLVCDGWTRRRWRQSLTKHQIEICQLFVQTQRFCG